MEETCQLLTIAEIVELNRLMIDRFGGIPFEPSDDNMINPGSLEYALSMIQGSFGFEQCPTPIEKAAILAYRINNRQVFRDANKRTGMASLIAVLQMNGYAVEFSITDYDVEFVALCIAEGQMDETGFIAWVWEKVGQSPIR